MDKETSTAPARTAPDEPPEDRCVRLAGLYRDLERLLAGKPYRVIKVEPNPPLVVERLSDSEVSLSRYGTRNGAPIRDPEVGFEIRQQDGLTLAEPFYYRNELTDVEHWTLERPGRDRADESFKPQLHEGLCRFAERWLGDLREQGFFEAEESPTAAWP